MPKHITEYRQLSLLRRRTLTQGVRGSSPAEVLELMGLRMSRGRIACGTLVVPRSLRHPLDPLTILRFDTRIVSLSDGVMRNPSEAC